MGLVGRQGPGRLQAPPHELVPVALHALPYQFVRGRQHRALGPHPGKNCGARRSGPGLPAQVWDFARCEAEATLAAHGGDVKAAAWHPSQARARARGRPQAALPLGTAAVAACARRWRARPGRVMGTAPAHTPVAPQDGPVPSTSAPNDSCKVV